MVFEYELNQDDATAEARHIFYAGPYEEKLQESVKKMLRTQRALGLTVSLLAAGFLLFKYLTGGVPALVASQALLVFNLVIILFSGKMFIQSMLPGAAQQIKDKLLKGACTEVPPHRMLGWRSLRITDEQLCINTEYVDDVIRPGAVDRVDETENYFFVCLASSFVCTFPKRGQTPEAIDELRFSLQEWSGKKIEFIPA